MHNQMIGIYARVSTEEQARSGFSLNDQLRACRKKAATDQVLEYMDEGISGEFLDRPALSRLRTDIRAGKITRIICLDPDRLSRKLMHQLLLTDEWDQKGVELQFVNGDYAKTPEGQLFYSMRGAIAEFEKAKINERMSRGRREKARQGRVLRDFSIYGYDYHKATAQLVINPAEAAVVRQIFRLFTEPNPRIQGMNGIARLLTEQGVPTKRGASKWHRQVIRQILANRTYIGEFYQNRWNTEGLLASRHDQTQPTKSVRKRPAEEWIYIPCPAIIDADVFEQAQLRLEQSRRRSAGTSEHVYLLSGLVRCGICGQPMLGQQVHNWGKRDYIYAHRKAEPVQGVESKNCRHRIKSEELERFVWNALCSWLQNEHAMKSYLLEQQDRGQQAVEKERILPLLKEKERITAAKTRLLRLFAEGHNLGLQEIGDAIREWAQREEQIDAQIREEERQLVDIAQMSEQKQHLPKALEWLLSNTGNRLGPQERREIIRHIIKEICVSKTSIEISSF